MEAACRWAANGSRHSKLDHHGTVFTRDVLGQAYSTTPLRDRDAACAGQHPAAHRAADTTGEQMNTEVGDRTTHPATSAGDSVLADDTTTWDRHRTNGRPVRVDAGNVSLSGIAAEPAENPRGLLVALHGGGSRAAYFHSPGARESSLVELAASLGWRAVSLDRPGYGDSTALQKHRLDTAAQARILLDAVEQLRDGLPLVLVGHSMGSIVALQLARLIEREARDIHLLGTALSGAPLLYTPEQQTFHASIDASGPTVRRPPGTRAEPAEWLGPEGTYPEQLRERLHEVLSKVPSGEMADAAGAPELTSALLTQTRFPVQFAVAEYEATMAPAPEVYARAIEVLPRDAESELLIVRGVGHNMSLSHRARSYHLRVMSFAEQALAST